jgi:hypothetical protein
VLTQLSKSIERVSIYAYANDLSDGVKRNFQRVILLSQRTTSVSLFDVISIFVVLLRTSIGTKSVVSISPHSEERSNNANQ